MNWWSHLERTRVALAPSLLGADLGRLAEEVADVEAAGVDLLHLDVMDGHFVPNISFGADVCAAIARAATRPLDCHLMIAEPERYLDDFVRAGCHGLTIHWESQAPEAATGLLTKIRERGALAGLSLNPDTPLPPAGPLWEGLDLLLIMSVVPGFCGQSFRADVVPKVAAARDLRESSGLDFAIQVDGGVGPAVARELREAGADILVAASAIMGHADRGAAVATLRAAAEGD